MGLKKIQPSDFDDESLSLISDDYEALTHQLKALFKQQNGMTSISDIRSSMKESYRLLDELAVIHERVSEESIRDPLTGVFNRRFLEREMQRQFLLAEKGSQNLTFMLLDIDHFGQINKQFGHEMGDRILKVATQAIRNSIRYNDLLFRYGGDEFVIILPDTDFEEAKQVARRILSNLPKITKNILNGHRSLDILSEFAIQRDLSVSLGLFHHKLPDTKVNGPEDFVRFADFAANRAKTSGRNQACVAILHPDNYISFSSEIRGPVIRKPLNSQLN